MSFFHHVLSRLLGAWSGNRRLWWENHELKTPQEHSDEEEKIEFYLSAFETVPAESVRLERKAAEGKKK